MDQTFQHAFYWFFTNNTLISHAALLMFSIFLLAGFLYVIKNWGF